MTEKKSKVCSECKQEKLLCDFHKDAKGKFGVRPQCKKCKKERNAKYHRENSEKIKERKAKHRQENLEKIREREAKYSRENHEKKNAYRKKRYKNDENFRIAILLRNRLWYALKSQSAKKSKSAQELAGCSRDELWEHLEKQFKDGMIRQNLGKWHVDHIKPCSLFDLTDPEQQKECFNYKNLQPLWAEENLRKGAKW